MLQNPQSAFRYPQSPCSILSMSYQTLLFEIRDGIAFVTINRHDKLNALNDQVMLELAGAAERIATEPDIKGAILTGSGPKSFVAGADIGDLSRQGPFDGKARAQRGQAVLRRLETCGKPEVKLGIAPGYGGTQRLPRLVGKGVAMQLILTGEMIDAQEAYRIGLVNKVVPAADLLAESEK